MASDIVVSALFTQSSGQPATGLALADIDITIYRRRKSDGTIQTILNAVNPTEEVGGGIYTRAVASADVATWDYYGFAEYTGAVSLDVDFSLQSCDSQLTEEEIWTYVTRTLTQAAAQSAAGVSASHITIVRGDTMSVSITGLGDISSYVSLDFTVKGSRADADADAIIRIRLNASGSGDGLLRFNKAAATASKGSITITDAVNGNITIALTADMTADLAIKSGLHYDIQMITASAVQTLAVGRFTITADATRAVS